MAEPLRRMVERVGWMSPIHYEVLAFYDNHDIIINPSSLAANIGYESSQYVSDTCTELAEAGLLYKHSKGPKFALTDDGRAFISGDLEAEEIEEP